MQPRPYELPQLTGDFLKDSFTLSDDLRGVTMQLHSLAAAAGTMGNFHLSERLYELASRTDHASDSVRKIASDRVNVDFQQAQRQTGEMLRTLVAGAKLGADDPKSVGGLEALAETVGRKQG